MVRVDFYCFDQMKWLSALEHERFTHHFLKCAVAEMFFDHCNFAEYHTVMGFISVNGIPRYELDMRPWQDGSRCGAHVYLTDRKTRRTIYLRNMIIGE